MLNLHVLFCTSLAPPTLTDQWGHWLRPNTWAYQSTRWTVLSCGSVAWNWWRELLYTHRQRRMSSNTWEFLTENHMSETGDMARFSYYFTWEPLYDFMESWWCNHIFNVGVHKGFCSDEFEFLSLYQMASEIFKNFLLDVFLMRELLSLDLCYWKYVNY